MKFRIREVSGLDREVAGGGAIACAFSAIATDASANAEENGFAFSQHLRGCVKRGAHFFGLG